jgi:uncharacterized protein (TIGR03066 family)
MLQGSTMRNVLFGLGLLLVISTGASAEDKFDAKLLVGSWEMQDAPPGLKLSAVMTKDGKITMTQEAGGKAEKVEGVYKLEGNTLTVTLKLPDGKEHKDVMTVTKLTADEIVTKDAKGKVDTMKKVKLKNSK